MRFNQQTDLSSQRNFQKSVLGLFIAFICALFAAGCTSGGDGGGFIASPGGAGGGVANAGNGSVTFNFVRAQNAIVVPTNTVNLRFEFFTGLEGTGGIVLSETHPFASAVTIDNVPSTAQSSKVTALTAEGFPVAQFTVNVAVAAGQTTTVSSTDGTLVPVTLDTVTANPSSLFLAIGGSDQIVVKLGFSNGEFVSLTGALVSEATFSSSEMTVASVDASGNVTGLLNGVATITADIVDYPGRSVNVTTQVGTGVINPPIVTNLVITSPDGDPVDLPVGTQSSALTVTATFDTVGDKVVTQTDGVTFTSDNPNVSVNANQEIVVAAGASAGETATITANFMGTQDTVGVTVNNAVLQTLSVTPSSVSLPFGGFEQALAIQGNFSNGTSVAIAPDSTFLTYTESPASDRYAVGGDGVAPMGTAVGTIVSAATDPGGTANPQTLRLDYDDGAGQTATANVDVTVGAVMVTSLTITPSPVTLSPGQVQEFVVLANLSQGNPVDVSNFDALTVTTAQAASSMDTDIVANGKQVVAVTSTPDGETATATFAIAGFTQDVAVTVLQEYLTSVRYEFAGNPIVNQTVNLPRGYVGLVECYGTFTSGAQRRLNFDCVVRGAPLAGAQPGLNFQCVVRDGSLAAAHPRLNFHGLNFQYVGRSAPLAAALREKGDGCLARAPLLQEGCGRRGLLLLASHPHLVSRAALPGHPRRFCRLVVVLLLRDAILGHSLDVAQLRVMQPHAWMDRWPLLHLDVPQPGPCGLRALHQRSVQVGRERPPPSAAHLSKLVLLLRKLFAQAAHVRIISRFPTLHPGRCEPVHLGDELVQLLIVRLVHP